jgi:hypothetical protein
MVRLHASGGASSGQINLHTPNFRMFRLNRMVFHTQIGNQSGQSIRQPGITSPFSEVVLTSGWYTLETSLMHRFRLVNNDAEFVVIPKKQDDVLSVELETRSWCGVQTLSPSDSQLARRTGWLQPGSRSPADQVVFTDGTWPCYHVPISYRRW